ncbi:lytic transglycosylase domain-containing protein [Mesorhizobium australicum]|uniref:Transglycosylase SLT domain-containing protein n=1 Tax=Mesorhizobium australicum TaxID=536018 RepID=A0A1X7NSE6_9HYPH|nr:lytic transglycosylase domain-containing protein [Mesorhizobium australicum]SMH40588.1 Transglycosylase SLT domain-containing protein [Mesorhizobium australicum]
MSAGRHSTFRPPAFGLHRTVRSTALLLLSGLSLASVMPASMMAQDAPFARPSQRDPYAGHVAEASRRFGIPIAWIKAVMRAESAGDRRAISFAGAMGLMQIMPATWTDLRTRHGLGRDPYDPRDNILAGTAYLREMLDRYGTVGGMLAAYNAGPARYDEYVMTGRPLPAETRAYVASFAPRIDGSGDTNSAAMVEVYRSDWTRSPLFFAQFAPVSATAFVSADRSLDGRPVATTVRTVSVSAPQPNGLFVARAAAGEPR